MVIRRVVSRAGVPHATIARDAGLSYAAIRAWINGEREPRPESLAKLAGGLRKRAQLLEKLAAELDNVQGEG